MVTKTRKAQSATEYLMTYGWAILAIAIVGALLYTQVFQTKKCAEGAIGFPITGAVVPDGNEYSIVSSSGDLTMLLKNTVGKDINISYAKNNKGTLIALTTSIRVNDSKTGTLVVPGFKSADADSVGKCYSDTLTIIYQTLDSSDVLSGVNVTSSGTLNGKLM